MRMKAKAILAASLASLLASAAHADVTLTILADANQETITFLDVLTKPTARSVPTSALTLKIVRVGRKATTSSRPVSPPERWPTSSSTIPVRSSRR